MFSAILLRRFPQSQLSFRPLPSAACSFGMTFLFRRGGFLQLAARRGLWLDGARYTAAQTH